MPSLIKEIDFCDGSMINLLNESHYIYEAIGLTQTWGLKREDFEVLYQVSETVTSLHGTLRTTDLAKRRRKAYVWV
jgi:hypothetical protein